MQFTMIFFKLHLNRFKHADISVLQCELIQIISFCGHYVNVSEVDK